MQMHNENIVLLARSSKSLTEIFRVLRKGENRDKTLKDVYSNCAARCWWVYSQTTRIESAVDPNDEIILQILNQLESISSFQASESRYARLRILNERWGSRHGCESSEHWELARTCLDARFADGTALRDNFTDALMEWIDIIEMRFPEDGFQSPQRNVRGKRNRNHEPSYTVSHAAQSLFEALRASANCSCHPAQELAAKLCLSTHRAFIVDTYAADDFRMFLESPKWLQEAHVWALRDPGSSEVYFALYDKLGYSRFTNSGSSSSKELQKLCAQIQQDSAAKRRLELEIKQGRLYKHTSFPRPRLIDEKKPPVSLHFFLAERSHCLTEKTKRILAVLLSYALLHLHETPWIKPTWDSSQILFLQTCKSAIPLNPFVKAPLSEALVDLTPGRNLSQEGEPDDILGHPFPGLVAFAAMLMELSSATPLETLWSDYEIDGAVCCTDAERLSFIFDKFRRDTGEKSKFNQSIDKCLTPATWMDHEDTPLCGQVLRSVIYQEVVMPLEDELSWILGDIIDTLDELAANINFGSWGQVFQSQQGNEFAFSPSLQALNLSNPSMHLCPPDVRQGQLLQNTRFFDGDELSSDNPQRSAKYAAWRESVKKVHDTFLAPTQGLSSNRVKIAVLDTGIDEEHPYIFARDERVVERYN
ncbi:hypothetical protein MGG_05803 [Pyricularia oryzae 70-15]|uniref:DUF7580 domain-containing protein n=3 Tax=Pyricularia oryzae TaxID=318829 RepID=G4N0H5_PYRO7|nr:uncharacterized protein MGG_05803 [Pyricularia oryzae 70-15]EHA52309.1 hypothetical protein MGG_05803 [Pyricularia oryzae 70-15]KAI7909552.1 hypothetical protein M9X92_011570 [Pyricularia oryzae]